MTNIDTAVIVGAGPTGLVLACGLLASGVPVRVLDAAEGPATSSRALGLQPRGVEVLDRLGALGDLPERGVAVHTVVVHVGGRELARLQVGQRTRLGARPALLLSQATIEEALRARLAALGGGVEWNRPVVGVDAGQGGVTVRLATGEHVETGWVVGCDGAHSRVRAAAGIAFPGVPLGERFLLADVEATLPFARNAVAVWLAGDALVAAFPLPGPDRWRLMGPAPDAPAHPDAADVLTRLTAMLERLAGLPPELVRTAQWTSAFHVHRRLAQRYRAGRVLLAGDAAHIHSPFGGQGMNTGIGDAENLAWKLALVAHGRAGAALLDTYEAERRPVAEDVLASTTGLTRVVLGGGPVARLVRDHVAVPLMNRPRVQRLIAERSSQLQVGYRRGPLGSRALLPRPQPGDRVRDLPARAADGRPTRLHAELGGRWAVLADDPGLRAACAAVATARLGGVAGLAPTGGGTRDALLVRPDGHLAWRGRDAAALRRWLDAALPQAAVHPVPAVP